MSAGGGVVTTTKSDVDVFSALGLADEVSADTSDVVSSIVNEFNSPKDIAEKFVEDLEALWLEQVRELANNSAHMAYFGISADNLIKAAKELVLAAHRLKVFQQMVETVREQYQFKTAKREAWVWKQVAPACEIFNFFISNMGCLLDRSQGPTTVTNLQDQPIEIFMPIPSVSGELELGEKATSYETKYFLDFLNALQHQIKANAEFQVGFKGDAKDNAEIGKIIVDLRSENLNQVET